MTLTHRLAAIEQQRQALLSVVRVLPDAQRRWRPAPTSWSALDVIEHLVRAETVVLGDLADVLQRPPMPLRLVDRARRAIVWGVLRSGVRVRAPSRGMLPTGDRSFEELAREWDARHEALRRFAAHDDPDVHRRRIFRHPVAGPLNLVEALQLLTAHLGTHARQLERIASLRA